MALIVPDVGAIRFLKQQIGDGNATLAAAKLRLYKNDYTPTKDSLPTNFTQADFDGYAEKDLSGWTAPVVDTNHARSAATPRTWQKAGAVGNNVYGYYVLDSAGNLLFAERFADAPRSMNLDGDAVTVPIIFTDTSEF